MSQSAAIVYMSHRGHANLLVRSLILLCKNFKYVRDYPIIVFYENFDEGIKSAIKGEVEKHVGFIPDIQFEEIRFDMPSWISTDPSSYSVSLGEFWMGYRHMCRYYSGGIYRDERLAKYEWYWRLDSDSYLLSPIDYDPFERMAQNGQEYAYMKDTDIDHARVCVGLWECTKEYMEKNSIPMSKAFIEHSPNGNWDYTMYYTNFEIGKLSFWRSKEYMGYFDHLDKNGGIYYHRWGDNVIHWLGVNMLMDESKIWRVEDMAYQHNNWVKNLSAFSDKTIPNDILFYVDEGNPSKRRERLLYAIDRYQKTGIDGCNWND